MFFCTTTFKKYIQSSNDLVLSFYYQNERDRKITPHKKTKSGHVNQCSEKMSLHCLFCTMTTRLFIHNKKSIQTTIVKIYCQDLNGFFDWRQQKQKKKAKCLFPCDERVPQHNDDRVSPEEHLGDVPVLIHRFRLLLPFATLGDLRPHLLHVLQHHVTVSERRE